MVKIIIHLDNDLISGQIDDDILQIDQKQPKKNDDKIFEFSKLKSKTQTSSKNTKNVPNTLFILSNEEQKIYDHVNNNSNNMTIN